MIEQNYFMIVPDDDALLARYNPILSSEPGEDVDNCIFRGWLKNESSVSVALSGGCPFSDTFEVKAIKYREAFCSYFELQHSSSATTRDNQSTLKILEIYCHRNISCCKESKSPEALSHQSKFRFVVDS